MENEQTTRNQQERELKNLFLCKLFSKLSAEDQQDVVNVIVKRLEKES